MQDFYKTLCVSSAATREEIRRAYRILARRYHPDVNPGNETAERFRQISAAYEILSDSEKRKQYDQDRNVEESFLNAFDRAHKAYRTQQQAVKRPSSERPTNPQPPPRAPERKIVSTTPASKQPQSVMQTIQRSVSQVKNILHRASKRIARSVATVSSIALLEVSLSVYEAISGTRKSIEVPERNGETRKLWVSIPPGVRQGSVVKPSRAPKDTEEVIVIIRVAHHPWISISHRGLTIEIPISVKEAMEGAKIVVPSLGDPLLVTVEPGIQSGTEVRLKGQGIIQANGARGDLYIRFMVKLPSKSPDPAASETVAAFEMLYTESLREHLPKSILAGADKHE